MNQPYLSSAINKFDEQSLGLWLFARNELIEDDDLYLKIEQNPELIETIPELKKVLDKITEIRDLINDLKKMVKDA